jgi:hypothetical protein
MSKDTEWYEWGYRLADGTENWQIDYGVDGVWIGMDRVRHVRHVDIGDDDAENESSIRDALAEAGVEGVVLRRGVSIVYGEVEER